MDRFKFGSNDFKNPITIKLYVIWLGIIKCFKSIKKIIIKDIIRIKNNKVVVVNPKTKKTKRKEIAAIASTKKYWKLITDLQHLHFPFKSINEKNGILSYQLIFFLHFVHFDLPVTTLWSNGSL